MARPYSDDFRAQIIRFYEAHDDYTQPDLAVEFNVSLSFLEKLLRRWRTTQSSAALPWAGGRQRTLKDHGKVLQDLVAAQPDVALHELQVQVAAQTNVQASPATFCRELQRLRLKRKKSPASPANNNART
jgi:transposase